MNFIKILKIIILLLFFSNSLFANTDYQDQGLILFEKKQFNEARFKFEQDIVNNPKSEISYLYLSKIFKALDKNKLEEQNLKTVILLNPKNEEAIFNLSTLRLKESDYDESKKLINKLLSFCKNYCQKSKKLKIEIENSLKK
jgi:tetratricopeptide (TPR) repeat protein